MLLVFILIAFPIQRIYSLCSCNDYIVGWQNLTIHAVLPLLFFTWFSCITGLETSSSSRWANRNNKIQPAGVWKTSKCNILKPIALIFLPSVCSSVLILIRLYMLLLFFYFLEVLYILVYIWGVGHAVELVEIGHKLDLLYTSGVHFMV